MRKPLLLWVFVITSISHAIPPSAMSCETPLGYSEAYAPKTPLTTGHNSRLKQRDIMFDDYVIGEYFINKVNRANHSRGDR